MGKEAAVAAPQRAAKADRQPERIATASVSGVHDSTSAVEHMQHTAGNAAVTEHIEAGALDPRNAIAASAVSESAGRPLDHGALRMMAAHFDHDLSRVRVHDDARSLEALEPLSAEAFALGQHIVVPRVALDATSPRGRALLAHEIAHTVQQSRGARGAAETSAHEGEAHGVARAVGGGQSAGAASAVAAGSAGIGVARQPKEKVSQSFHEVAQQANKYWSTRISGWPGDDALRDLWTAKKYDEFADTVRDYQRAQKNTTGMPTDGVVNRTTMTALKANPIARPKAGRKDAGEKAATPISEKAPPDGAPPAKAPAAATPSAGSPPAGRRRFDGALGLLKEARKESLAGNQAKAQDILQLIDEKYLATFRYDDSAIRKVFPNMNGMALTATLMLVQRSTGAIRSLRTWYRIGGTPSQGTWDAEITSFGVGAEPLRALCGDTTGAEAKNLQAYDKYSTIALGVAAAVIAAPLIIAGGIELGPAALAAVQGSPLYMLALEHPVAAVDLGVLAVGKTIQLVSTGEITISLDDIYTILYHGTNVYYSSSGRVTSTGRGSATITIETEPVETTPGGGASRGAKASGAPAGEHESGGTPSSGGKGSAPTATDAETPSATQNPPAPAKAPVAAVPAMEEPTAAPVTKAKPPAALPPPNLKSPAAPAASKPMRAPPGKGARGTATATSKTVTSAKPSNPEVSKKVVGAKSPDPEYSASPGDLPPTTRVRGNTQPFLNDALKKVSIPSHPLHELVVETANANGTKSYAWRTTTITTKAGKQITGRFEGNEHGVTVQVGHADAFASGAKETFMIEDADMNQAGGQTIESKGAFSSKVWVEVQGVIVELKSLMQWERLGVVPPGTVASAKKP